MQTDQSLENVPVDPNPLPSYFKVRYPMPPPESEVETAAKSTPSVLYRTNLMPISSDLDQVPHLTIITHQVSNDPISKDSEMSKSDS